MMSLTDAMGPELGKSKGPAAIAIKVAPAEHAVDDAAAQLMKAMHAHDAAGVADAIRACVSACMDEYEHQSKGPGLDEE
jgi:hypothetical protein